MVVLVGLIYLYNLLRQRTMAPTENNISPTGVNEYVPVNGNEENTIFPPFVPTIKILTPAELVLLDNVKKILPYENGDFVIQYFALLDKFVVEKKTVFAQNKLDEWLKKNNIYNIVNNYNLIVYTDQPINQFIETIEETIMNNRKHQTKTGATNQTSVLGETTSDSSNREYNQLDALAEILKIIGNFDWGNSVVKPTSPPQNPSGNPTSTQPATNNIPTTLNDIFNEVGNRVGVPPRIIEGIMSVECPSTFKLSPQEIAQYSTPGASLPFCKINFCSAGGPMQMTTGVDDRGDSTCPRCGLTSCPNAWASYGHSVNTNGGYSHTPNPLNIRDSVYGAAAKIKKDSGATTADNWTQDQVFRVATRYYGSCSEKHRYERLGNRTYCEYLWWYYNSQ